MGKTRRRINLVLGCLVFASSVGFAQAQDARIPKILSYKPHQEGVVYTIPTPQQQAGLKLELVTGSQPGSNGWLLVDAQGQPLRRFFDTDGDKQIDVWSYYLDGVEVYREIDSNHNKKPDQYRWLNSAGTKWGIDSKEDGKIDSWKVISAEEVSQEILQAVITKDFARFQALWITDAEMKSLELPAAEIARIQTQHNQAVKKFQAVLAKLSDLGPQTKWVRLEAGVPQCLPAGAGGLTQDLVKYSKAAVLYDNNNKPDWLQIGDLIQVGPAWRIIDGPSLNASGPGETASGDPELQKLMEELGKLDMGGTSGGETSGPNPKVVQYNLQRADILQRIVAKSKVEERDQWLRQLADCFNAATLSSPEGDRTAYNRLLELEKRVAKEQPGSQAAAYITFREMQADFALRPSKSSDSAQTQNQLLQRLAKFVEDYPQGEDTPDALIQLGMVSELMGKETEAKNWYKQLIKNHPDKKSFVDKADGALRRFDLEGKSLELTAPMTNGSRFDMNSLHGKVVIVYYWDRSNQQSIGDFARLRELLRVYGSKGLELVCINLDNSPPLASANSENPPGMQIAQAGGLESALANQYGIVVLPTMFLVGQDGKVVSRTVQIATVEDEIKKLLK
jgi:tetratricopeptide (TPR) repeat protein